MSEAGQASFLWGAAILAIEIGVVTAAFWLGVRRAKAPRARRALWRGALLAFALVTLLEFGDARKFLRAPAAPRTDPALTATFEPGLQFVAPGATEAAAPAPSHPAQTPFPWELLVAAVWVAGAAFFLLRGFIGWWSWRALLRASAKAGASLERAFAHALGEGSARAEVRLVESFKAPAPLAGGVLKRCILLPSNFEQLCGPAEQRLILAHEAEHLRARDTAWVGLAELLRALLWWHPAIWIARRHLLEAMEEAADAASVSSAAEATALADCLVRFGRRIAEAPVGKTLPVLGIGLNSALAARVQKLLSASEASWRAPESHRAKFYSRVAPFAVTLLVILSWRFTPVDGKNASIWEGLSSQWLAFAQTSDPAAPLAELEAPQHSLGPLSRVNLTVSATNPALTLPLPTGPLDAYNYDRNPQNAAAHGVVPIGRSAEEYRDNPKLAWADGVKMLGPSAEEYRNDPKLREREGVLLITAAEPAQPPGQSPQPYSLDSRTAARYGLNSAPGAGAPSPATLTRYGIATGSNAVPLQALTSEDKEQKLRELKAQAARLQELGYTDKHPKAVDVKRQIAELEKAPAPSHETMMRYGLLPSGPNVSTHAVKATNGMQERLSKIMLAETYYISIPFEEVVKDLAADLRKRSNGRPINFVFDNRDEALAQALKSASITVDPPVRGVSVLELLDILRRACPVPMTHSIEEYGVVFTPLGIGQPAPVQSGSSKK